jgi:hypothetical protein
MATIRVEVVYALPDGVDCASVTLAAGATAAQALRVSGILERHPGLRLQSVGVFGRQVGLDTALADGDRVEIYRPLAMDPKEARRRRASGRR